MVNIGHRPILWHVMKYYAHYGHKDFILCLGHRGDLIRQYFLHYDECISNDFVLTNGGRDIELYSRDIDDWRITFVDTGLHANIGQRLRAVEKYLADERMFLANYSDGLSDLPLTRHLEQFRRQNAVASFVSVKPNLSYHLVSSEEDGVVTSIEEIGRSPLRINGGFFIFRREIFSHLRAGEELVQGPFQRLLQQRQLAAYTYDGFWMSMDTFKDRQQLEDIYARGQAPWEVWQQSQDAAPAAAATPAASVAAAATAAGQVALGA
jgi:glucose-1-phosphate cytidylyltransferase